MKHQRQEQLKAFNDKIAIAVIKNCILEDKIKEAVEYAEQRHFTPEQFGIITKETYNGADAEAIYKLIK